MPQAAEVRSGRRRSFALLVAAVVAVWLLVMLVGGDSGVLAMFRARSRLDDLQAQVAVLEAENQRLREEVRRLEHDDGAVERIAREELLMARPDEEILLVPAPSKHPVVPVAKR